MRFFTFIFIIYLLAIAVLPCNDAYNECNNPKTETEILKTHNHKTDYNDNCSPFCTCACCSTVAGFTFQTSKIEETNPDFFATKKIPLRNFSITSNYCGNIWQPPKING